MASTAIKDIILDWKRVTNFPFLERFSLKFKDQLIERRYQLVLAASDNLIIKQFLLIKFFFYLVVLTIEFLVFRKTSFAVLVGVIPAFIFLILYLFYKGKKELFKDLVLTLMNCLIGVTFYYMIIMFQEDDKTNFDFNGSHFIFNKEEYALRIQIALVLGALLSFQAVSFIYLIQMWYFRIISVALLWISISATLNAGAIVRVTYFFQCLYRHFLIPFYQIALFTSYHNPYINSFYQIKLQVIYIILLSFTIMIWFFFQDFKLKKLQFYYIYNLQMEQEGWQKLINQNLPCPVIVVKQNEEKKGEIQVVFHNQNTQKEFKNVANMDINWIMNNIYVNTHHTIESSLGIESQSKIHPPQAFNYLQSTPININEPNSEINEQTKLANIQPFEDSASQISAPNRFLNTKHSQKQSTKSQQIGGNNTINPVSNLSHLQESQKSFHPDFITFQKFDLTSSNKQKDVLQDNQQNQSEQQQEKTKNVQTGQLASYEETDTKQIRFLNMKNHLTSIIECNKYSSVKQKNDHEDKGIMKKYVPLKELIIKKIENYRNAKSQQSLNNLKNQNTNYLRLEKEEYYTKCILNLTLQVQKGKKSTSENTKTSQKQNAFHLGLNQAANHQFTNDNSKFNTQLSPQKKFDIDDDEEDEGQDDNQEETNNNNANNNQNYTSQYNNNLSAKNQSNQNQNSLFIDSSARKLQRSGGVEYYELRLVECIWENELSILILMTNISYKIKTDIYREINHYKDDLINTVTHDLKTPLNGIISILESAISLTSFSEMQKCVQIARKNGVLLTAIINDIQDFQNMKKGEFKLNPQKFNLNELMLEIRELIEYQAKSKGLEFRTSLNVENTIIYNDFNRIKQIVLNLIGNALKFTFQGYVTFEIFQVNNQYLRFSISDTGIGISSKLQEKIFKPYGTYKQKKNYQHGCGIGLAICQKLVQKVGYGSIGLYSKENQGSTFNFMVHRYLEDEQYVMNLSKYQLQESIQQSPKKVKNLGESFYKYQQLEILKKKEIMCNYSNSKSFQHIPSGTLSFEILEGQTSNNHKQNFNSNQFSSNHKLDSDKTVRFPQLDKDSGQNIDSFFKFQNLEKKHNLLKQSRHINRSHSSLPHQISEILLPNDQPNNQGMNGCNFINQSQSNFIKMQQSQVDIRHDNSSYNLTQKQIFEEMDFEPTTTENTVLNKVDSNDRIQAPLFSKFKFINTLANFKKMSINQITPLYNSNSNINKVETEENIGQPLNLMIPINKLKPQENNSINETVRKGHIREGSVNFQVPNQVVHFPDTLQTQSNNNSYNMNSNFHGNNNVFGNNTSNASSIQSFSRKKGRKVTQSVLIQNNTLGKLVFSKYKNILIVDDTGFNILALKLLLKQQISSQTEVFEAFNGRQALEITKEKYKNQQYITLILMDVNMPIMDGIEATRIIKNLVKEGKMNPLKIVMITAFGSLKDRYNAKIAGADAYMEKPVTVNALIAAIEQAESGQD